MQIHLQCHQHLLAGDDDIGLKLSVTAAVAALRVTGEATELTLNQHHTSPLPPRTAKTMTSL